MEVEKEIAEDCMDEGVADEQNCEADNTNCEADNTNCLAENTNYEAENTNYDAENTNSETDQMDCESGGEKCKLDGEMSERQLDVAGLARAYKQMSTADDEGNYKDVLCIAIGSLCGQYLHCKFVFSSLF